MRCAAAVVMIVFAGCADPVRGPPAPRPRRDASSLADAAQPSDAGLDLDQGGNEDVAPAQDAEAAPDALVFADADVPPRDAEPLPDAVPIQDAAAADAVPVDGGPAPDASPPPDAGPASPSCGTGRTRWARHAGDTIPASSRVDIWDVAAHPDGSATIAGSLAGRETFGTGTPRQVMLQGGQLGDALIARYDAAGQFLWARLFNASGDSVAISIGGAADGSIVVTGNFEGTLLVDAGLPTERRIAGPGSATTRDAFIARVDATGQILWVQAAGGPQHEHASVIAVAPDGSSFASGFYGDFTRPNTMTLGAGQAGEVTLTSTGRWETLYFAAYDPQGNLRWARQGGGDGRDDFPGGAAYLPDGSVVVTGKYDGEARFDGGGAADGHLAAVPTAGFFLARYSQSGALVWLRGATGHAAGIDVAESGGALAVAAVTNGGATFGPGEPGATTLATGASLVARYRADGSLAALTRVSGSARIFSIAANGAGRVAVAGSYYHQATFFTGSGDRTLMPAGWDDAFASCLGPTGPLAWVLEGRGILQDHSQGVAIAPDGDIIVAGRTRDGMTFQVGDGTSLSLPNGEAGFIARIGPN